MSESNGQVHTDDKPDFLKTFTFFGLSLKSKSTSTKGLQGVFDCPFCGKAKKLYAASETGEWDCKVCGESGNIYSFMKKMHDGFLVDTKSEHLAELAEKRGIPAAAFASLCKIAYDSGQWYLPICNFKGKLSGIKRYQGSGPLYPTPNTSQHLYGAWLLGKNRNGETIYVCEGEWDTIALRWLHKELKIPGIVVGVPSAQTFKPDWLKYFQGRNVVLLYDKDLAGRKGRDKAVGLLRSVGANLKILKWKGQPEGVKDINDLVKHLLAATASPKEIWEWIESHLSEPPESPRIAQDASEGANLTQEPPGPKRAAEGKPPKFETVIAELRKHIYTWEGMERSLAVASATILSARMEGDPLWVFIVGPAGSGKTLILRMFEPAQRYCSFPSAFTPKAIISGYRDNQGNDYSLLASWKKKCVIIKDFTVLMSHSAATQEAVYGIMRDAYDGRIEWGYGNQKPKVFDDCRFSFLAGVTHAIHTHSHASVGERFLKCEYLDGDHDNNAHIRAAADMADKPIPPILAQMVSDFIDRDIPEQHIETPEWFIAKVTALAQLVAVLRTQVERDKHNRDVLIPPQSEIGTRLSKQFTRLGQCLAVVFGMTIVTKRCWEIVRKVGLHTAYGWNRDIFSHLAEKYPKSTLRESIADAIGVADRTLKRRIDNMTEIKAATRQKLLSGGYAYRANEELAGIWRLIQK